jgi:hypothetical protein
VKCSIQGRVIINSHLAIFYAVEFFVNESSP